MFIFPSNLIHYTFNELAENTLQAVLKIPGELVYLLVYRPKLYNEKMDVCWLQNEHFPLNFNSNSS